MFNLMERLQKEEQDTLPSKGVELLEYIPAFAYIAKINDATTIHHLASIKGITEVNPILPLYKIDPALFDKDYRN